MPEISFDELDFEAPLDQVPTLDTETITPVEVAIDDLDFDTPITEVVTPVKIDKSRPVEGPRRERTRDVYKKTLEETGSAREAQIAATEFRRGQDIEVPFAGGDPRSQDIATGLEASIRGFGQTAIDIAELANFDVAGLNEKNQQRIAELNSRINDDDFFSAANLGRSIPTLATLPISYSSKALAFMLEGGVGYAEARGEGQEQLGSAISGLIAGGGTASVMKAFEILGKKSEKVLNEIKQEFATEIGDDIDKIYTNYAKFTGKKVENLTNYDKTMAIISQGKDKGAAYLKVAAENDIKAKQAIDNLSESKKKVIKSAGGQRSKGQVAKIIKPLEQQQAFASDKYNEFKNIIFNKGPQDIPLEDTKNLIIDELENIPDLQKSAVVKKVIKKLEGQDTVSLEDLFDIREAMNAVTVKMKKVNAQGAATIDGKQFIDSIITNQMPQEFAPLWTKLKDELSLAYATKGTNTVAKKNNTFGKLLSEATQGTRTFESILADVAKASDGPKGFMELMKAVGSDKMRSFEQGLIKEIYSAKAENLGKTVERLKHLGFVTPEGKQLKRELRQLDEAFSSDDYYRVVADILDGNQSIDGTSITANLLSKLKYSTMSSVWDYLKVLAPTEKGKFLRHMNRVTKAIKKAKPEIKDLQGINPEMYQDFKDIVRSSIERSIDEELEGLKFAIDNVEE